MVWCAWAPDAFAGSAAGGAGHVNGIKVVSDKTEDVTSIEAILGWMIKPGISDREKGLAVWETVVKFRHQNPPPNEYLEFDRNVHDAVKTFNVYGYGMCCCASANIAELARAAGLEARGRIITSHSVPEVSWGGAWHLLDASLITWFPNARGDVASVDEIIESVTGWYAQNPAHRDNDGSLRQFMRGGGWRKGPAVLAASRFYDENGWLPARSHGWYSTMQEYDGKNNGFYEYGYSSGYRATFRLRAGESLTRNWSNRGLHVNMDGSGGTPCINDEVGKGELGYSPRYGDLAPGRIGNGTLLYRVPLSQKDWRSGAWSLDNVKTGAGISPMDRGRPAEATFRMQCPYVFLGGKIRLAGEAKGNGWLKVLLSTNNGLDWTEIKEINGKFNEEIDVKDKVFRRYDYYVRLAMAGDVAVAALEIENDIQHSQRALPALGQGPNAVTVHAGPAVNTVTAAPSLHQDIGNKNEKLSGFRPVLEGARHEGSVINSGGRGSVTFPVATPGDIRSVRFGGHFRADGNNQGVGLMLSFDGGRSWAEAGSVPGPYRGYCKYVEYDRVPPGARTVLVRYQLSGASILSLRADVDYWDTPDGRKPRSGAFPPFVVTYVYKDGAEKRVPLVVKQSPAKFSITCGSKPEMRSIIVEVPAGQ